MSDIPRWNVFTRNWFLVGQYAAVHLQSLDTVECKGCLQVYNSYGTEEPTQGNHICAEVKLTDGRWMVHCGYGSDFDMREFWYLRDFPEVPFDGLCDWCIRRMLLDGVLMDSGKEHTW